jgi:solute carrier family 25 aspartate/glutamate transporter 12/13
MFYSTGPHGNAHQAKLAFTANAAADAEGLRTLYSKSNQRSPDQFINALSNPRVGHYFNGGQAGVLFKVADVENKNRITLEQFLNFEKLFESPFAEYTILAKLIDPASKNMTVGSLKSFFKHSPLSEPTIDFNCDPLKLTLGSDDKRVISIEELSHIVRVIRNELIRHEYATLDPKKTGSINGAALQSALTSLAGHKLNPTVKQKIATNFNIATFAEFVALLTVLSRTDSIARVLAVAKSKADNSVTAEGFALSNMKEKDDQFTPLEIRMMFKIINGDNSTVQNSDSFAPLIDPSYVPNESVKITSLSAGMQTLKSVYSFALGSIGGAVGAAAVYPIGN